MENNNSGWNEWSKHVLIELERLNDKLEGVNQKIQDTNTEITKIGGMKHVLNDLKEWKKDFDESTSVNEIEEMRKEIDNLKMFKTQVYTIGTVITLILSTAIALLRYLN